jgi:DNA (cytosine-5)-methyltransferase 1
LRCRFPGAAIHADVATLDFAQLPRVDVITAGFPCQDISRAGTGLGLSGRRSGLWRYCLDALRVVRPRVGVFENVAVLTRRGLREVLADLAALGYDAEWHCVPAASLGAPHQRDRIFIMAYPDGSGYLHGELVEHADATGQPPCSNAPQSSDPCHTARISLPASWDGRGHWAVEPGLGRMAHGIPHGMDRLRCLGNAVVPAVAQAIAEAIKDALMHDPNTGRASKPAAHTLLVSNE